MTSPKASHTPLGTDFKSKICRKTCVWLARKRVQPAVGTIWPEKMGKKIPVLANARPMPVSGARKIKNVKRRTCSLDGLGRNKPRVK